MESLKILFKFSKNFQLFQLMIFNLILIPLCIHITCKNKCNLFAYFWTNATEKNTIEVKWIVKLLTLVWLFNVQPWAHSVKPYFICKFLFKTLTAKFLEYVCVHLKALGVKKLSFGLIWFFIVAVNMFCIYSVQLKTYQVSYDHRKFCL